MLSKYVFFIAVGAPRLGPRLRFGFSLGFTTCGRCAFASFSGGAFSACCRRSLAFASTSHHSTAPILKSLLNIFRNDVFVVLLWVSAISERILSPVRRAARPSALPADFAPVKNKGLSALNNDPK